ncbi:E3 ubiquitin-protein ligase RFWD3 [Drosophila gunungcola]|nr:E3 ubiquitin-protein ligase RFWD3 [Drosophila gunungcola]
MSQQDKMSSAEQESHRRENKILSLLEEFNTLENELERVEQQPVEESDSSLEEKFSKLKEICLQMKRNTVRRRGIQLQLATELSAYATNSDRFLLVGEHVLIRELRAGVDALSQRLDRMSRVSQDIICSICLAPWTSEGRHHLVSLRCGHLFGCNCIHTAIRRFHRCPICRRRAYHSDVRRIYGRNFLPF